MDEAGFRRSKLQRHQLDVRDPIARITYVPEPNNLGFLPCIDLCYVLHHYQIEASDVQIYLAMFVLRPVDNNFLPRPWSMQVAEERVHLPSMNTSSVMV